MHEKYGKDGLVVLSVSLDLANVRGEDDASPDKIRTEVKDFLQKRKFAVRAVVIDEDLSLLQDKLHFSAPPCLFVFNREGKWTQLSGDRGELQTSPPEKLAETTSKIDKLVQEALREKK